MVYVHVLVARRQYSLLYLCITVILVSMVHVYVPEIVVHNTT